MHSTIFADDTTICFKNSTVDGVFAECNRTLSQIYDWILCNKISFNFNKTSFMLTTNQRIDYHNEIFIGSNKIDKIESVKFLGIMFDNDLKFKSHVKYIGEKISKTNGILYRLNSFVPKKCLITLYYSLIYPYLIYCNLVWGNSYKTNLRILVLMQKKSCHSPQNHE